MVTDKIIQIAHDFIGEKEKPNNSGFKNPEFETRMAQVGWSQGEAWCASFAKLVWLEAYKNEPKRIAEIQKLFSKSATQTYRNFDNSDWKTQTTEGKPILTPQEGALVVWRMGNTWTGHIGIVCKVISATEFETIEGNTDAAGGREGIEVAHRRRFVTRTFDPAGFNLLGFILPKPIKVSEAKSTV